MRAKIQIINYGFNVRVFSNLMNFDGPEGLVVHKYDLNGGDGGCSDRIRWSARSQSDVDTRRRYFGKNYCSRSLQF